MTNKELWKNHLRNCFYEYEELTEKIFSYPCDDLHGTFSSGDCNCTKKHYKEYLSKEQIEELKISFEKQKRL